MILKASLALDPLPYFQLLSLVFSVDRIIVKTLYEPHKNNVSL